MQCNIAIKIVDYLDPSDRQALIELLDMYARDPMGGGEPLAADTRLRLCDDLSRVAGAISWLAFKDGKPVGLLNALPGYSTFKARPQCRERSSAVVP